MNFFTVVLGVLFALFAWNNPEVATVIVVAVVVVWVAIWAIGEITGKFLDGYRGTTTTKTETLDESWKHDARW